MMKIIEMEKWMQESILKLALELKKGNTMFSNVCGNGFWTCIIVFVFR